MGHQVVISRPDISCVLAWLPGSGPLDTEFILVKEFRSTVRNSSGFVYELPGGSSFKPHSDVLQTAADELFEECGIRVDKARLVKETSRQATATVTTHHVHLFSCKLTMEEMAVARQSAAQSARFGNASESERTQIEIIRVRDAMASSKVDFTTLGLILEAIVPAFDTGSV